MRKRNVGKFIYLNELEAKDLAAKAKRTSLNESALIRMLIRGFSPKEKPDEQFYAVMQELSAIANAINFLPQNSADPSEIKREAERWNAFRMEIKRRFLEPEKLELGFPQSLTTLWGAEHPRSGESFAANGESDERSVMRRYGGD